MINYNTRFDGRAAVIGDLTADKTELHEILPHGVNIEPGAGRNGDRLLLYALADDQCDRVTGLNGFAGSRHGFNNTAGGDGIGIVLRIFKFQIKVKVFQLDRSGAILLPHKVRHRLGFDTGADKNRDHAVAFNDLALFRRLLNDLPGGILAACALTDLFNGKNTADLGICKHFLHGFAQKVRNSKFRLDRI